MPLYEFECENKKCDKRDKVLSFIVPLSRFDEEVKCPRCGKPLKRRLSAPMFKMGSL